MAEKKVNKLDDEITHWYLVGCHILQHPELDGDLRNRFEASLETLKRLSGATDKEAI